LLIENCAHGGARSDYGMMPYSDRINRSDNSDPVDVLKLHEGFSTYILPRYAGGAGNVATSPNGQNGRVTPLKFRAHLGMTGSMSVGFDLLTAKKEDIDGIKEYIKYYKTIRPMLHSSYLYRLSSVLDNGIAIWQYTARDRSKAVVFIFAHGVRWGEGLDNIKLVGLKPTARYEINGKSYSGDTLMKYGHDIRKPGGDYYSEIIEVTEIKN
jgi:alpha-galactosidase